MKIKQFFETHPLFRYEEFAEFMADKSILRPESWQQQLQYHLKVGNLIHIRKFLYATKPTFISEKDFWLDPYLIASKASTDAIIAYHTALELHGIAYSTFEEFSYLTRKRSAIFTYKGQRFRPVILPISLVKNHKEEYCTEDIMRQGINIKLTNLERTVVDILDRPDLGGGWEEIWRSLDNIVNLDWEKFVEYTLQLNNATIVAKVGFFIDQRPMHLAVNKKFIEKLLPHIPSKPHYMNRNRQGVGKYIDKWRLIVPIEIINRLWEEPNADNI